jgi:NAD-dependent deacetylase
VIRPDVVLFEEPLPDEALATLRRETRRGFDAVVAIGTTASFPYIVQPVVDARTRGAPTVEINPGASAVSGIVDVRIRAGAAEAMEAVLAAL